MVSLTLVAAANRPRNPGRLVSSAASRHLGVAEEGGWRRAAGEGQDGLVGHRALVLERAQVRMFDPSTARRASWQHQRTNLRRRLSSTSDGAHPAARVQRQDGEADERASRGRSRKHELRHNVRRPVAAPEEHSHRDVVRAVAGPGVAEVCGPGSTTALAASLAPRKDNGQNKSSYKILLVCLFVFFLKKILALRSLWPTQLSQTIAIHLLPPSQFICTSRMEGET
jgi:hypothetical protein